MKLEEGQQPGEVMVQYDVYVFCDECSVPHTMRIRIELDDGPAEKKEYWRYIRWQRSAATSC